MKIKFTYSTEEDGSLDGIFEIPFTTPSERSYALGMISSYLQSATMDDKVFKMDINIIKES